MLAKVRSLKLSDCSGLVRASRVEVYAGDEKLFGRVLLGCHSFVFCDTFSKVRGCGLRLSCILSTLNIIAFGEDSFSEMRTRYSLGSDSLTPSIN